MPAVEPDPYTSVNSLRQVFNVAGARAWPYKLLRMRAPGAKLRGPITSPGYEHVTFEATVETVEPEQRFSFRWHPYAIEHGVDYSSEPTTLVVFTLEEVEGGTLLTVVESGFDKIPASRRAKAFEMNAEGWAIQMENIKRHLAA